MTSGGVTSRGGEGMLTSSSEFLFTWIQSEIESFTTLECVVKNPLPSTLNSSLCAYLRDGRALVLLTNALDLKSEQETRSLLRNFGNLMTFFSLERVQFFIRWCRDEFLLEEKYLFSSAQLIDEANEKVVIECLMALQKKLRPEYTSAACSSSTSGTNISIPVTSEVDTAVLEVESEGKQQPKTKSSKLGAFLTQFPNTDTTFVEEEATPTPNDSSTTVEGETKRRTSSVKKLQIPAAFCGDFQQEEDATKKTSPASSPKHPTKSVSKLSIPAAFSSGNSISLNHKAKIPPQKTQDVKQTSSFTASIQDLTQESDALSSTSSSSPSTSVRKLEIPVAFRSNESFKKSPTISPNAKSTHVFMDIQMEDTHDNSSHDPVKKRPSKLEMFLNATEGSSAGTSLIEGSDMSLEVEDTAAFTAVEMSPQTSPIQVPSPKNAPASPQTAVSPPCSPFVSTSPIDTSFNLEKEINVSNTFSLDHGSEKKRPSKLAMFLHATGGTPTAASLSYVPDMSVEVNDTLQHLKATEHSPQTSLLSVPSSKMQSSPKVISPKVAYSSPSPQHLDTPIHLEFTVDDSHEIITPTASKPVSKRPSKLAMFLDATGSTPTAVSNLDGPDMSVEVEDAPMGNSIDDTSKVEDVPKGNSIDEFSEVVDVPKGHSIDDTSDVEDVPKGHSIDDTSEVEDVPKGHSIDDTSEVVDVPKGHSIDDTSDEEDASMGNSIDDISPQTSPFSSPCRSPKAVMNSSLPNALPTTADTIATMSDNETTKKRPSKLAMFLNATGGTPTASSLMDCPDMSLEVEDTPGVELSPQPSPLETASRASKSPSPKHVISPIQTHSPKQANVVNLQATMIEDTSAAAEDDKEISTPTSAPEPVKTRRSKLSMFMNTVGTSAASIVSVVSQNMSAKKSKQELFSESRHNDQEDNHDRYDVPDSDAEIRHNESDDQEDNHDGYDVPDSDDERDVPLLATNDCEPPSPSPALLKSSTNAPQTTSQSFHSSASEFDATTESSVTKTTSGQSTISLLTSPTYFPPSPPALSHRFYSSSSETSSPTTGTRPSGTSSPGHVVSVSPCSSSPSSSLESPIYNGSNKSLTGSENSRNGSSDDENSKSQEFKNENTSIPLEEYKQLKELLASTEISKHEMEIQLKALKESNGIQSKELEKLELNQKLLEEKNFHLTSQLEQLKAKMITLETNHQKESALWKQSKQELEKEVQRIQDTADAARYAAQIAFQARDDALAQLDSLDTFTTTKN